MRACRRCCPAEAPPGSRRSGRRDRIPRDDSVRALLQPAAIVGTCPSRSAGAGRARRAVDLEQDHAGYVSAVGVADLPRSSANETKLSRVVVDAERGGETHQADREHERHKNRAEEVGCLAVDELDRERDDRRVQDQRAEPESEDGEREKQPDQERPQHRVEHRDQDGDHQDCAEARHVDSRQHGETPEEQGDQKQEQNAAEREPRPPGRSRRRCSFLSPARSWSRAREP